MVLYLHATSDIFRGMDKYIDGMEIYKLDASVIKYLYKKKFVQHRNFSD